MNEVAFGLGCPKCGYSAAVSVSGGGNCPECGTVLQALPENAKLPETISGFECSKCGFSAGMLVGADRCPECDSPIS